MSKKRPKPKGSTAAPSVTPPEDVERQNSAQDSWQWGATSKQPKAKVPKRVRSVSRKPAARPFPGIQQTRGVCGGDPCIRKPRIPVWVLVRGRQLGMTEAELLDSYPSLQAQDLVNAWAYMKTHRDEIERQILANESA
jgi:uncharacterized protein (DUF433 family)